MDELRLEKAGMSVNEGCLAVYPDVTKPDCTLYPIDLIEKIEVKGDIEPEAQEPEPERSNVVDIRGKN